MTVVENPCMIGNCWVDHPPTWVLDHSPTRGAALLVHLVMAERAGLLFPDDGGPVWVAAADAALYAALCRCTHELVEAIWADMVRLGLIVALVVDDDPSWLMRFEAA